MVKKNVIIHTQIMHQLLRGHERNEERVDSGNHRIVTFSKGSFHVNTLRDLQQRQGEVQDYEGKDIAMLLEVFLLGTPYVEINVAASKDRSKVHFSFTRRRELQRTADLANHGHMETPSVYERITISLPEGDTGLQVGLLKQIITRIRHSNANLANNIEQKTGLAIMEKMLYSIDGQVALEEQNKRMLQLLGIASQRDPKKLLSRAGRLAEDMHIPDFALGKESSVGKQSYSAIATEVSGKVKKAVGSFVMSAEDEDKNLIQQQEQNTMPVRRRVLREGISSNGQKNFEQQKGKAKYRTHIPPNQSTVDQGFIMEAQEEVDMIEAAARGEARGYITALSLQAKRLVSLFRNLSQMLLMSKRDRREAIFQRGEQEYNKAVDGLVARKDAAFLPKARELWDVMKRRATSLFEMGAHNKMLQFIKAWRPGATYFPHISSISGTSLKDKTSLTWEERVKKTKEDMLLRKEHERQEMLRAEEAKALHARSITKGHVRTSSSQRSPYSPKKKLFSRVRDTLRNWFKPQDPLMPVRQ